jgi:hypothetical protein
MSQPEDERRIELYIESPVESQQIVELLNMTAHYHRTEKPLWLGHTVNFGKPWLPGSECDHGLISLPYLEGPRLENATVQGADVRVLWLIPITKDERDFKKTRGLEALEQLFEKRNFNYVNPARPSVVRS